MDFFHREFISENQQIKLNSELNRDYRFYIKREDEIHQEISGNKLRKLKYIIEDFKRTDKSALLTFGGAYSNHIAAVAKAGQLEGFKTIGIIRGEELKEQLLSNPTLRFAAQCGMELKFVDREQYRALTQQNKLSETQDTGHDCYIIPVGGTSELAVKGCEEILTAADSQFDYICVSVGTGGTIAGILNSADPQQEVLGFSALNGTFQQEVIQKYSSHTNYKLIDEFSFGGYAKIDSELIRFINEFKAKNGILLDPVYTAKMVFGIYRLMSRGYFRKNSRILAVHTGGLQGIEGMNMLLERKKLPQILQ